MHAWDPIIRIRGWNASRSSIYIYIFIYRFEPLYRGLKKKEKRKKFANGIVKLQREFSAALLDGDSVFYTLNVDGSGSRLIVLDLILAGWIARKVCARIGKSVLIGSRIFP